MKSIALRFSDSFAPPDGTIKAHEEILAQYGQVWYGKLGSTLASSTIADVLENDEPRILLIHSGRSERYWAFVSAIQKNTPPLELIPQYYRENAENFHCWFLITRFELAEKDVMSKCEVPSSKNSLSMVSRYSMSPYFRILWNNEEALSEDELHD